ncbi:HNH endonuclease [Rhodoblastus sp.]|uniref:HNH endonuclease n=1 Tax=Rhodoblastus sp. TaxID=1962975 RepID=UPI002629B20B|nr:HNH endonuclease [Rhodoblastus sp.]
MVRCAICDTEITAENDSLEHLIPNALGGRRKISGFICRDCNSSTGETWDAALAAQLAPLSLLFDISRERGDPPPLKVVTTAGERLTVGPAGSLALTNPGVNKKPGPSGGFQYQITARSMEEARQILGGLKRKHPEIDIEAILAGAEAVENYAQGAIKHDLTIGGEVAGRSIVKSCLAMAFANGVDWQNCGNAVSYLRSGTAIPCFGYYNEKDLLSRRPLGIPLHCLAVRADPESGLILAYAEYFGLHCIVACLGEAYTGPLLHEVYAIDPRNGVGLDVGVELSFSRSAIDDIYAYKRISPEAFEQAASAIIGPAIANQHAAEQQRVLERAVEEAFRTCGAQPNEILTKEHARRISQTVAAKITPFILHRLRPLKYRLRPLK